MNEMELCNSIPLSNVAEIYDEGMSVLISHMGIARAEEFISLLLLSDTDYTKWHQGIAQKMTPEKFAEIIEESERNNPYRGNAKII